VVDLEGSDHTIGPAIHLPSGVLPEAYNHANEDPLMFDLLLRGGRVIDGAGNSDFPADVAVQDGRIAGVGALGAGSARETLDVHGLTVAPGFIDVHSHADALPFDPDPLPAKVLQGVTTEVTGNCGQSPFPLNPATQDQLRVTLGPYFGHLPFDWTRMDGYMRRLEEAGPLSNHAPLVGHNALRAAAMGYANRAPTADELITMQHLLAEALEDGAFGLSTGLIYTPGLFSDTQELVALAQVMRGSGRPYCTHPRGETHNLFNALAEAVHIGEAAGVPVQISHLKAAGRTNFGRSVEILSTIESARQRGVEVTGDIYPYEVAGGRLASLLPPWCVEGGTSAALERLKDPATRERVARDIVEGLPGWVNNIEAAGWDGVIVASFVDNPAYRGKSMKAIAEGMGTEPGEAFCRVLLEESGRPTTVLCMMEESDVRTLIAHPLVMIGSDAGITRGRPHPRVWGTYPRVLGLYQRDMGVFSEAEAIRKMTSYPAQKFGLFDRGLVRPGMWADLVVYDSASIRDTATVEDPERAPIGLPHVLVNGTFVVRDGAFTDARAGKVLRASS
jgi:N-acyl-D-amino-acid deacylase